MERLLLTPTEAAQAIGLSKSKLYELMAGGLIESVVIGRCRRVPPGAGRGVGRVRRSAPRHRGVGAAVTGRRRSSGEGSVYRRASDGLWVGLADLGWKKGKRRRKAVYGRTEREVRCKLAGIRRSAQRGVECSRTAARSSSG